MLSIIIPSVQEPTLEKTVADLKAKAKGEIEIIVSDGAVGMRTAINNGVAQSKGEYIMKTDEHCKFDEGFDVKLLADLEDNMILIPRRYKLNIDTWELFDDEPIDYERLVIDRPDKIGGVRWPSRAKKRKDILLDETMVFQGSCYMMTRKHWDRLGGLQVEGYGEFAQEAIELSLKTWFGGGRVMVSKKTWYAHKHRMFKRHKSPSGVAKGNLYSKDYWLAKDLTWLFKRFNL